jgi:uncharacterized repeat protein (TIGR03803 family)
LGSNGDSPFAGLLSDGAGDLFGTTVNGGASNQGTVFEIDPVFGTQLDTAQADTGKVSGLTASDTLDLSNLTHGPNMTVGYSGRGAGGPLSASNGAQSANIALLGNYLSATFTLASDGHGGTSAIDPPKIATTPLIAGAKAA